MLLPAEHSGVGACYGSGGASVDVRTGRRIEDGCRGD